MNNRKSERLEIRVLEKASSEKMLVEELSSIRRIQGLFINELFSVTASCKSLIIFWLLYLFIYLCIYLFIYYLCFWLFSFLNFHFWNEFFYRMIFTIAKLYLLICKTWVKIKWFGFFLCKMLMFLMHF